jgi:hypothetical protein
VPFDLKRVLADQIALEFLDRAGDGEFFALKRGFAPPVDSFFGRDLDERPVDANRVAVLGVDADDADVASPDLSLGCRISVPPRP